MNPAPLVCVCGEQSGPHHTEHECTSPYHPDRVVCKYVFLVDCMTAFESALGTDAHV